MKDAVIGVIKNTSWPYIRNYADFSREMWV